MPPASWAERIWSATRSAAVRAWMASVSGIRIANSSPPMRKQSSALREASRMRATSRRTSSPAGWPSRSLTPLKPSRSRRTSARGRSERRAGELDRQALMEDATVGQAGEGVAAAVATLRLVQVGVREVGGDQLAEELERFDVAVVEMMGLGGVDLEHADRLLLVEERHADHRAGVDTAAGLGVDPLVVAGVVAAQDAA